MTINKDTLREEGVTIELFAIFYEDQKEELEKEFLSQDKVEDFTLFCIEKWKEFDSALFTS